jgi:bifunctional DNA-binding transcriptional regulator/antitoxin component of YhaV-PrlF toxin-antitoxin module
MENHMERKLREISGSIVITIPKQVCDLYGFKAGDKLSIEPIGVGELRLRKTP